MQGVLCYPQTNRCYRTYSCTAAFSSSLITVASVAFGLRVPVESVMVTFSEFTTDTTRSTVSSIIFH